MRQAANKYISFSYSSNKQFYVLSLKATLLHQALTYVKKALHTWQIAKILISILSITQKINKHIARANKLAEQNILSIIDNNLFTPNVSLKAILYKKKDKLWRAQNLELNLK